MANPLSQDLDHVLAHTADVWKDLAGTRIFVTGGTGFFGCWLLESFAWASDRLQLGSSMTVLTRSYQSFRTKAPHLAFHPAIRFVEGDVNHFDHVDGPFSHVIHAATPASAALNQQDPLAMLDTIVGGTRRVLDFAVSCGARKFLLTSSGAVYGKQPSSLAGVPETFAGTPDTMNPQSAYAEGKRVAEFLCAVYAKKFGLETKIARCFAFTGPYLPLDAHFAAGNFIQDQLRGGPIEICGDGTPRRSYLYAADLAIWLWTILCNGRSCRPYNVGSDEDVAIAELAAAVASLRPGVAVRIAKTAVPGAPVERYVPDVTRARAELNLAQTVSLADGVRRTSEWAAGRAVPGVNL
jgi:nucleoside-diphosphate-sugar epimerase